MWGDALVARPDLVSFYYEMLKDESVPTDIKMAHRHLNEMAVELLANHFFEKEGLDAFPVRIDQETNKEEVSVLQKEYGKYPISVPRALHLVLQKSAKIGTLEELIKNADAASLGKSVGLTMLPADQLSVLQRVPSFYICSHYSRCPHYSNL